MLDALAKGVLRRAMKPSEVLSAMRLTAPHQAPKMAVLAQK